MKIEHKKELKRIFEWKRLAMVLLGNTIYGMGVVAFILPQELITGGTTGLGLIANYYADVPIEVFAAVFNVLMFGIAGWVLGTPFAMTTVISTFYFPCILAVLKRVTFFQNMTEDLMLGTILAGLLIGVGIGVVIRAGASTGGVDIPPLVMNKKFGIPISVGLDACDFLIHQNYAGVQDSSRNAEEHALQFGNAVKAGFCHTGYQHHAEQGNRSADGFLAGKSFLQHNGGCQNHQNRRQVIAQCGSGNGSIVIGFKQEDPVKTDGCAGKKQKQGISANGVLIQPLPAEGHNCQ